MQALTVLGEETSDQAHAYVFLERWRVSASAERLYDTLLDFDTYPLWGAPSYVEGKRLSGTGLGSTGRVSVRGALPYVLTLQCTIVKVVPSREIEIEVEGDLAGRQHWTFVPRGRTTEVSSDFRANTNWAVLSVMTPLLRPVFRWNHKLCKNRAMEGLERYLAA
jgi:hypothetical protein